MLEYVIDSYETDTPIFSLTVADPESGEYLGSCGLQPLNGVVKNSPDTRRAVGFSPLCADCFAKRDALSGLTPTARQKNPHRSPVLKWLLRNWRLVAGASHPRQSRLELQETRP
jgi:hypothetical protein